MRSPGPPAARNTVKLPPLLARCKLAPSGTEGASFSGLPAHHVVFWQLRDVDRLDLFDECVNVLRRSHGGTPPFQWYKPSTTGVSALNADTPPTEPDIEAACNFPLDPRFSGVLDRADQLSLMTLATSQRVAARKRVASVRVAAWSSGGPRTSKAASKPATFAARAVHDHEPSVRRQRSGPRSSRTASGSR
jgi:hypothetical protein